MLDIKNTAVVIIDIQERLVQMLNKQEPIKKASEILIKASQIMELPIVFTEQYPKGLGKTILDTYDIDCHIIEKTSFSAMQTLEFVSLLNELNKQNIVICGIETHICVYQTVIELMQAGYNVVVAKDACASRTKDCFKTGIDLMKDAGAKISNVEIILFELLKTSKSPFFKSVQALIK